MNSDHKPKVHIIGAGVSGLAAAITLEKAGYSPVILEAEKQVGGRVATNIAHGTPMDRGFQVLLDSYPALGEFLDLKSLDLIKFYPGAKVMINGEVKTVGDPLRKPSMAVKSVVSSVGSLRDKYKLFTLSEKLKSHTAHGIFKQASRPTIEYLRDYGFSEAMLSGFLVPFFGGVFLEQDLQTSSRMFEFVFKMFAEGSATIPRTGMQAIPEQMLSRLAQTELKTDCTVNSVKPGSVITDSEERASDYTIIATTAENLIDNLPDTQRKWQRSATFYYETPHDGFGIPIIGLSADSGSVVNNFHFLHDVFGGKKVVSATVVHPQGDMDTLRSTVKQHLSEFCSIETGDCLHMDHIRKALPVVPDLRYDLHHTETQLMDGVYLAGDHLVNASLNAAMLSGKAAARAVIGKMENHQVVG